MCFRVNQKAILNRHFTRYAYFIFNISIEPSYKTNHFNMSNDIRVLRSIFGHYTNCSNIWHRWGNKTLHFKYGLVWLAIHLIYSLFAHIFFLKKFLRFFFSNIFEENKVYKLWIPSCKRYLKGKQHTKFMLISYSRWNWIHKYFVFRQTLKWVIFSQWEHSPQYQCIIGWN